MESEDKYTKLSTIVTEAQNTFHAAVAVLTTLSITIDDFALLLASLPSGIIETRDEILYTHPECLNNYLEDTLEQLAKTYGVQDTFHKLALIEQAMIAELKYNQAVVSLERLVQSLPQVRQKQLIAQASGQVRLF